MNEQPLIEQLGNPQLSAYQQYLRIFVGEESPAAFLRYEVLTGLLGPMPGLGVFSPRRMLPMDPQSAWHGKRIWAGGDHSLSTRIAVGERVMIDDGVVLDAKGATSKIQFGDQILFGRQSILSCNEAQIRIGNFFR